MRARDAYELRNRSGPLDEPGISARRFPGGRIRIETAHRWIWVLPLAGTPGVPRGAVVVVGRPKMKYYERNPG